MIKRALLVGLLGLAAGQAMACYTVYDRSNRVVYQAQTAPVDMRLPIGDTLPRVFPGGHMVVDDSIDCPLYSAAPLQRANASRNVAIAPAGTSPLLTERSTALAMNLPHTVVAGGAALVPPTASGAAVPSPALTLVPSEAVLAQAPSTAVMGAGPAPQGGTVITELRDPPVTIIQQGNSYRVR